MQPSAVARGGLILNTVCNQCVLCVSFVATSFGIALPAWIVDQKNSMLVCVHLFT